MYGLILTLLYQITTAASLTYSNSVIKMNFER